MATAPDPTREVVRLARLLERQLAKRRRWQRKLDLLDAEVRSTRKLLSDLTHPFVPAEVDRPCPNCSRLVSAHSASELSVCDAALEARL